jgi:biopolymer transport protein ExbD
VHFKKGKDEETRLGLTPLIDIVFLLLIFFMLTSHFDVASGVRIKLPEAAQRLYDSVEQKITLIIDRSGAIYLEGEKLDETGLRQKLVTFIAKEAEIQLVLQADKDVRHGRVVQAMDIAKSVGIRSLVIAARWEPEKAY